MADCPGVLHLAAMADGGLARVRLPGGRLTASQARAVADLAERLGSGTIDLTNRANLQIRGLPLNAGAALAEGLRAAGLYVDGPADRRRNVLLDPLAGLDPTERCDLRPLGAALVEALAAASWIGKLSPKFSFVLDGGGRSGVGAMASDVGFLAVGGKGEDLPSPLPGGERSRGEAAQVRGLSGFPENARPPHPALRADLSPPGRGEDPHLGFRSAAHHSEDHMTIRLGGRPLGLVVRSERLADAALVIARMAADAGPDARARDLSPAAVTEALVAAGFAMRAGEAVWPVAVAPSHGVVATGDPKDVAVVVPVAVGRLDPRKLRWLADAAERHGEGVVVLAPWSAAVIPGVAPGAARALLEASEALGFPPAAVVERLRVIACAGAPACVRAREPAKAIGLALLEAAAARPDLLPAAPRSIHVSACAKGCAGSAPADLLMLGSSEEDGFSLHIGGAPRRPGPTIGRAGRVDAFELLARLRAI